MLPKNLVLILHGCLDLETLSLGDTCTNSARSATYSGLSTLLQPLDAGTPSHDGQKVCSLQATVPYESCIYSGDVIHALTCDGKRGNLLCTDSQMLRSLPALQLRMITTCNSIHCSCFTSCRYRSRMVSSMHNHSYLRMTGMYLHLWQTGIAMPHPSVAVCQQHIT